MAQSNRLAAATSPYLQQHADNPVDWYPWGEEALRRAAQEQKPILLSVGYSACHWCHVMAHESFEDPSIAKLMNALYVSIKVDREERPDLDKIYQLAHQLLTQRSGGWPLTLFLMPDTTPFFGGTYFPKEPRYGLPGFGELLQRVHDYYSQHGDELRAQNISLIETLHRIERLEPVAPEALSVLPLQKGAAQLRQQFDATHGGFGGAPKFPHPPSLERCLRDFAMTGDQAAFNIAVFSLNKMIRGGVYDQLGGGFYRYSVDAQWQIPHFEKMLYDNAQLLALCAEAAAASNSPLFDAALQETGDWVMREMQAPTGGYYSTLDADSEGHEGKFYAWSLDEVKAQFDARTFAIVAARFGLDGPPNFEGQWHLRVARDPAEIAKTLDVSERRVIVALSGARQKLFEAREGRIRPGRDDKILTAWNGLMIKGMARTGRQLGRADFVTSAERALDYLRAELWRDGRLLATAREGRAHLNAYLDDHVFLIDGILALVEARWRDGDLEFAVTLAELVLDRFTDPETGALFMTSDDHERLILRTKPFSDDSTPAGNGIAARVFLQLGHLLGETRYLDAARRILTAGFKQMADSPMAFCTLLTALEEHFRPGETLVLRGDGEAIKPWLDRLAAGYRPNRMVVAIPTAARSLPGVLAERTPRAEVTAYHCRGLACSAPITDLAALEALL